MRFFKKGENSLKRLFPKDFERELDFEDYLAENMSLLEDGLEFIKKEEKGKSGRIDISCSDIFNNLTIIELKINKDQDDALIQALHYSKERNDSMDESIEKLKSEFDIPEHIKINNYLPRIILVAPGFTNRLIDVATYLSEQTYISVDLFEYDTMSEGKKDYFVLNPVIYNDDNRSVQKRLDALKNEKLVKIYSQIQKNLKHLFECEVYVDASGFINFRSKKNIWFLYFELDADELIMFIRKSKNQNHPDVKIKSYTDFEKNLERIEKSYLMTKSW